MSTCRCHIKLHVKELEILQRIESILEPLAEDQDDFEMLRHLKNKLTKKHEYLEQNKCHCEDE